MRKLTVLELPYNATMYAPGPRELDYYKAEGIYQAAGLPVELVTVTYDHQQYPADHDTFEAHRALGKAISDRAYEALQEGNRLLMTGGDCSSAVGIAGALRRANPDKRIGFVWLDAHGDLNTPESSLSGMIGGMPFGVCWGNSLPEWREAVGLTPPFLEEDCILADGRCLDSAEVDMLAQSKVTFLNTEQFQGQAFADAVGRMAEQVDLIYFHIDADILDGRYVPDHLTIAFDGPSMEEVQAAIDAVMATGKVAAYSVVSVYFPNDKPGKEISARSGADMVKQGLLGWRE